jgi:galacturan 1,4-alpha-galacturonidase
MNLPNQGQIANLPADIVVETFGTVSSTGARGIAAGPVPAGIHNILTRHIENQEMIVTAAQSGDRRLALQALANDPLITDLSKVGRMLDELLTANKRYLPQF